MFLADSTRIVEIKPTILKNEKCFTMTLSNMLCWIHYITGISKLPPNPVQQSNKALRQVTAENTLPIEIKFFSF